ncbi:cysteine hydrolase family protein [Stenotrophomonas rhizophila]|uniref:cysteine hydrolase family protein n=1 Tax=Stenotrophomonas rhizophila TaxID=216778 RepID=UPI001E339267|nr:cysteine hydrolase family protein [Stenotrophomonas rhizophila]MCC7633986.1 cysteine hydrolase [Stenotrophomonas rhizophila]MCC7663320.1 cysteine hydrolase [Stenotrophomonas rhizophila]
MSTALIVVDIQNDYFAGGRFPLENSEPALANALDAIARARQAGEPVIGIQHKAPAGAPFLADGSAGAELHPAIADALQGCTLIEKQQADSFLGTTLGSTLAAGGVSAIRLVGMMTQHCITHTALSPEAAGLEVTIVGAACAAPTAVIGDIALSGLAGRCTVV